MDTNSKAVIFSYVSDMEQERRTFLEDELEKLLKEDFGGGMGKQLTNERYFLKLAHSGVCDMSKECKELIEKMKTLFPKFFATVVKVFEERSGKKFCDFTVMKQFEYFYF